jgi:hypothetical protein
MSYIFYFIAIVFIIYVLLDFKKKPNDNEFKIYYNSKYYRIIILIIFGIIAFLISLFVKQN